MKIRELIKENIDVNRVDLKLLNYLHKNSVSKNSTDLYKTLNKELYIDDKDIIGRVIKLYKNNPIGDDEIYDESINWVVPSENDYSNEVRAIAKSLNDDPELLTFRGETYDLEIYNHIPTNNLYEVGTYDDLVNSIEKKIFQDDFNSYDFSLLEKYLTLNEEDLEYNISEIIKEEMYGMNHYEMLRYIGGMTRTDFEYWEEVMRLNEVDLKAGYRNKNSLLKKMDKLESEKEIILQQIGDEEDTEEYSKYLDTIESKISGINDEYNNLLMYISNLEDEIKSQREEEYPTIEDTIKKYTHYRHEEMYSDYMENPYDYIRQSGLDMGEVIEDGLVELDMVGLIKELISNAMESDYLKIEDINNQSYFVVNGFNSLFTY